MIRLNWIERATYALGVVFCVIIDAVYDALKWLQCPAPDQPRLTKGSPFFSDRVMVVIGMITIAFTIVSITGLWIFQA